MFVSQNSREIYASHVPEQIICLCIYHLIIWLNFNFLHNSQWITFPTKLRLIFFLLHSLIIIIVVIIIRICILRFTYTVAFFVSSILKRLLIVLALCQTRQNIELPRPPNVYTKSIWTYVRMVQIQPFSILQIGFNRFSFFVRRAIEIRMKRGQARRCST